YGKIVSTKAILDKTTNKCKGVNALAPQSSSEGACLSLIFLLWKVGFHYKVCVWRHFLLCNDISSVSLSLSFYSPQQQEQDPTNLYISNLPLSMDEQELETMLKHFGQVISTRILRDSSGASRGVGLRQVRHLCHVSMESTEKCDAVISHFNGKFIKTSACVPAPLEPLLCKFADGGQKKRQSQNKFAQNSRAWLRDGDSRL
ncbi:unnamed protein product, partial [Lampetra planeri]